MSKDADVGCVSAGICLGSLPDAIRLQQKLMLALPACHTHVMLAFCCQAWPTAAGLRHRQPVPDAWPVIQLCLL